MENNIDNVIASFEQVSDALFNWFKNNRLKSNAGKCHVLVCTNKPVGIKIGDYTIDNSECEKLLVVKINVNLNLSKRELLMNAFFNSQFSYSPLIWICHSRSNNRKINMLHERCLRIIYNDKQSSFTELLNKDNSVSFHIRNIQRLVIEMFWFYNGLSPPLLNNIFKLRAENPYSLRQD